MATLRHRTTVYLDRDQAKALKALSERTRVPEAVYYREAIAELLKKYAKELQGRKRK